MKPSDIFKHLGAPLANSRWSCGSVRAADKAVFLRVWQDHTIKHQGRRYMMVTHHEQIGDKDNLGYQERLTHVSQIHAGAHCFMVMCVAEDKLASPRKIKDINSDEVFVGGKIVELNGDTWVELASRKRFSEVIDRKKA